MALFQKFVQQSDKDGENGAAKTRKKIAVAFVDFEHWYISMDRFYGIKPDIRAWRADLAEKYDIRDIIFFGDFSNPSLRAEIPRIREVSSYIIETQNASDYHKKDYTDFIMLDHIYQRAVTSPEIDVYVIFSGDGHFSSVTSFLVNRCDKEVAVYGVRDAVSMQLRNTATVTVDWPIDPPKKISREEYEAGRRRLFGSAPAAASENARGDQSGSAEKRNGKQAKQAKTEEKNETSQKQTKTEKKAEQKDKSGNPGKTEKTGSAPKNNNSASASDPAAQKAQKQKEEQKPNGQDRQKKEKQASPAPETKSAKTPSAESDSARGNGGRGRNRNGGQDQKQDRPEGKAQEQRQNQGEKTDAAAASGTTRKDGTGKNSEKPKDDASAKPAQAQRQKGGAEKNRQNTPASGNDRGGNGNKEKNEPSGQKQPAQRQSARTVGSKNPDLSEENPLMPYCRQLLSHLDFLEKNNRGGQKAMPNFASTVTAVAQYSKSDSDMLTVSLKKLIELGYVSEEKRGAGLLRQKVLEVNWDKCREDGIIR